MINNLGGNGVISLHHDDCQPIFVPTALKGVRIGTFFPEIAEAVIELLGFRHPRALFSYDVDCEPLQIVMFDFGKDCRDCVSRALMIEF